MKRGAMHATRRAMQAMRRRWIVELGELQAVSGIEADQAKKFLDEQKVAQQARQAANKCVFYGCTGAAEYLRELPAWDGKPRLRYFIVLRNDRRSTRASERNRSRAKRRKLAMGRA